MSLPDEKPVWNPLYGTLDNPYGPDADAVSSHRWCTRCNKETECALWATSATTTMWECNICGTSSTSDSIEHDEHLGGDDE